MSLHFNCVIHCEFPGDLPQKYVDVLRYLTMPDAEAEEYAEVLSTFESTDEILSVILDSGLRFLTDPTGRDLASFYTHYYPDGSIYAYVLQISTYDIKDDGFYESFLPMLHWLPTICKPGFIGYHSASREEYTSIDLFQAYEGKAVISTLNPQSSPRR